MKPTVKTARPRATRSPAICRRTSLAAAWTALPMERVVPEPYAGPAYGRSVSPDTPVTAPVSRPRTAAAICGSTVVDPAPMSRPRCSMCPDSDDRDPVVVVHELITAIAPGADRDAVAEALRRAAPHRPHYRQRVVWALEENPHLLTGEGYLAPHRAILRFIDLLHEAGVAGIVRPSCPRCHRVVRIDKPLDGQRVCRNCTAKSRIEERVRCGARREPATRDAQGRPLCPKCLITDPANLEACIVCGKRRMVSTRTPGGSICPNCRPLPTLGCSVCGRMAPCMLSKSTGQPRCGRCDQREVHCTVCGRFRDIHSGTVDAPVCGPCTKPDAELWRPCPTCGETERLTAPGPCRRCTLKQRLDELLTDDTGTVPPKLQALRDALAETATAMSWLSKGIVSTVLSDLASGRRPLTHAALDEFPDSQVVEHIRTVLVAAGALSPRDEQMVRLERHVRKLITSHATVEGRKILHRYATWHLLRRLRRRSRGKEITHYQLQVARQHLRAAVYLLNRLENQDLALATCRQSDLERWMTNHDAGLRREAGHFVRWALSQKIARDLSFPAVRWNGPSQAMDDEARWSTARRLLHDDTLKPENRLAGLLLLLYAQWPAAISRLTVDDIEGMDGAVRISFGSVPVELPEPVAELARRQVTVRRSHAARPDRLALALPRRPTRPTDQRLGHGRTTRQSRLPPRRSPLNRPVPAGHRTARRGPCPHSRHRHHRRRHMATSRRRRLGCLRGRRRRPQHEGELVNRHHHTPSPTARLSFRQMTEDDLDDMAALLGDPHVMRYYPNPKTREEALAWIDWNQQLYQQEGCGLWVVTLRTTGEFVGDCGLTPQEIEGVTDQEVGYHVRADLQGNGYATEAAAACRDYARDILDAQRLIAIIRQDNQASQRVAEKIDLLFERDAISRSGLPVRIHAAPL
jgi:RimJ/RimL family protein N-acetyltransferase